MNDAMNVSSLLRISPNRTRGFGWVRALGSTELLELVEDRHRCLIRNLEAGVSHVFTDDSNLMDKQVIL